MVWTLVWIVVVVSLVWSLGRPFYWKGKGVAWSLPLPLLGTWWGGGMIRISERLYSRHKGSPLVGFHLGPRPVLMIKSPALVNLALGQYHEHFNSHGIEGDRVRDPHMAGLLTTEGLEWRHLRANMTQHFTPAKIKAVLPHCNRCVESTMKELTEGRGKETEFRNLMERLTVDVVAGALFSVSVPTPRALYTLLRATFGPLLLCSILLGQLFPRLKTWLRLPLLSPSLMAKCHHLVSQLVANRASPPPQDFLDSLLRLREAEPTNAPLQYFQDGTLVPRFTDETFTCHVWSMFSAATETTGTTLAFCFYELALDREMQEKAREEATSVVLEYGENLPYHALARLTYIEAIVAETLRKYPVFHVLNRKCTKSFRFPDSGVEVEEGTLILIPIYSVHHDPDFYPEPEEFRPERFSEEEKAKRPQGTYLPFGVGPRTCIGMRLAQAEMTLVVCRILAKFKINLCSRTEHPISLSKTSFLTAPRNGIWLSVQPI